MKNTNSPVAVVVVNWNGIEDTIVCLNSFQRQSYKHYRIIVVDNGSDDNSVSILKEYATKHPDTTIIYNQHNYGFSGGVNTGIEYALNDNFDYVALINNDATVDKDWLSNLVSTTKQEGVGISTCLFMLNGTNRIDSTGEQYSKWGLPFPRNRNDETTKAPAGGFVFGASGGASLYKASMLREIGLFDEDFFAYYEDVDISFRAQLAGWRVCYNPTAIAYHKRGATTDKLSGFAIYQTFKNLPLLYIKSVPRRLLLPIGVRFYFTYLIMFLNAIKKGAGKYALKGTVKSISLTPKKISERAAIQRHRKVSASYIKSILWPDMPPDQTGLRKLRRILTGKK